MKTMSFVRRIEVERSAKTRFFATLFSGSFLLISDAMELSRYGGSLTITPILAARNVPCPPSPPPPPDPEVVVVEVEPDIILTDGYLEEEEEEEDEQDAAPDPQTDRYGIHLFLTSVADPVSGAFLTPWKLELGWVQKSGSGMNSSDHIISESLETSFWVKILNFFDAYPGSEMEKIRIRDGKNLGPGSGTNIPNPQHYF